VIIRGIVANKKVASPPEYGPHAKTSKDYKNGLFTVKLMRNG
jgi:hypothetical protein